MIAAFVYLEVSIAVKHRQITLAKLYAAKMSYEGQITLPMSRTSLERLRFCGY